ncbi:MAG: DUF2239 family protein, partial [Alphaproteobacteria bacterium]
RRVAAGSPVTVALAVKRRVEANRNAQILVFDAATSALIELSVEGSEKDVRARAGLLAPRPTEDDADAMPSARGPGRPKLGVVAREVTLLPRHWEWLNAQPGGASVALRKLVDEARRSKRDGVRRSQEAAYRFITAMAGDKPHYEDANRALFAGDAERFEKFTAGWPPDIRDHARSLAAPALQTSAAHSA